MPCSFLPQLENRNLQINGRVSIRIILLIFLQKNWKFSVTSSSTFSSFWNFSNSNCLNQFYSMLLNFNQFYSMLINFNQFIVDCPSCAGELLTAAGTCIDQIGYGDLIACIQEFMDPEHPCFDCITDPSNLYLQSQIKNMDQIQQ